MEKIDIICVGSIKEKFMRELCDEYKKRLSRFCKLTVTELNECRLPADPSDSDIKRALLSEAEEMQRRTDSGVFKIAMCIEGKMLDSETLAKKLENAMALQGKIAIFIGSSHGLDESFKASCDMKLSMSPMTFPHQLARGMLLEQIYRAYKIRYSEKYHK